MRHRVSIQYFELIAAQQKRIRRGGHGARGPVGKLHPPVALQQQHRRDRALGDVGKPAQHRAGVLRLEPDIRRALQMRHQHPASLDCRGVEFVGGTRAHQTDDGEKSFTVRQRQPHHRVHVARLHEAVVVVAREQLGLRHDLLIDIDRAGPPFPGSQPHQIARAPDIEKLALAGSIDARRCRPWLARCEDFGRSARRSGNRTPPQFLQRLRPAVGENSRVINRIEYSGDVCRIHHQASRGNEMAGRAGKKNRSKARRCGSIAAKSNPEPCAIVHREYCRNATSDNKRTRGSSNGRELVI